MKRAVLVAALVAALAAPAAKAAYWAPGATPVSVSLERREQADDTTAFTDVSTDGRYAVFDTAARNFFADDDPDPPGKFRRGGIFRRDLVSGELRLVAHGSLIDEASGQVEVRGATNPSVSGDGRFVAFSTGERLVPADVNDEVDVYVRDLSTGSFDLVSALDGSGAPATYAEPPAGESSPLRNPGSDLTRGAAISDDGRRVVFRTQQRSNLPARALLDSPPFQILVRDRQTSETRLVTRRRDTLGEPVDLPADGPAVISADGSTVAWAGTNAPAQTALLAGEGDDQSVHYYLWQRIASGPAAPTRRITGIADPDDPRCPEGATISDSPTASGPCYGPLAQQESAIGSIASTPPALSADGRRVLFVTGVSPRPSVQFPSLDVYMTSMAPGATRKGSTVELTRDTVSRAAQTAANVDRVALSAGGRWAAIVTRRTRFTLPALRQVGIERGLADRRELYLVDLQERTAERILRTVGGRDLDADVDPDVALSGDGGRIVFTSPATSLFRGDANGRVDAFAVAPAELPPSPPPEPPPGEDVDPSVDVVPEEPEQPARRLQVSLRPAKRGEVRLRVRAPAAGDLEARVRGRLPGPNGRPRGKARPLGGVERTVRKRGVVTVRLRIRRARLAALRRAGSLTGTATVTFVTRDDVEYARRLTVTFKAPRKRSRRPASTRRKPSSGARS